MRHGVGPLVVAPGAALSNAAKYRVQQLFLAFLFFPLVVIDRARK